jgi:hypothetical protein
MMHMNVGETKSLSSSRSKRAPARDSLVSRKRTRQGKYLSDISIDDILDNIHLTGKEASKNLGLGASKSIHHLEVGGDLLHHMVIAGCVSDEISVCVAGLTSFKRVCRFYGIQSWPQNNHLLPKNKNEVKNEPDEVRTDQFKSSLTTIQKDLENVKSVELSRDAKEREEMCTRIKELYSISCRMRVQNGFSMFNDSALLTLLQRLHS